MEDIIIQEDISKKPTNIISEDEEIHLKDTCDSDPSEDRARDHEDK